MKPRSILVAPSILAADWGKFSEEIRSVADSGADWIHIDVMDGRFVPPITFGADVVKIAKKATTLPLDVHLMIVEPERHIDAFAKAGATSITVHLETCPHLHRTLQQIKAAGCKAGVALNPASPFSLVEGIMREVDILLVMTVNPGWGGQKFITDTLDKTREAAAYIQKNNLRAVIEVDGGVTAETAKQAVAAGASVLVAGTAIFQQPDYTTAISSLRS